MCVCLCIMGKSAGTKKRGGGQNCQQIQKKAPWLTVQYFFVWLPWIDLSPSLVPQLLGSCKCTSHGQYVYLCKSFGEFI